MIQKSYKYRIYPTQAQKILLEKHFGACRWIYNWGLQKRIEYYQLNKKSLSIWELINELPKLKEKYEWLKEINSQSLQQSLLDLDKAYTKFFREKKGFPKFKSRKNNYKFYRCPLGNKIDFDKQKFYFIKFKEGIKIRLSRTFEGKIKSVTISRTPTNKYFVSVLVETLENLPIKPELNIEKAIGIDLGLKSFLVTSEGQKFDNPKFLQKSLKKLQRTSRWYSRKKKGSNNKEKARLKLASVHEKISNQRKDFLHKISTKLIKENQFDTFCIENLNISGMLQNKKLARQISGVSWAELVRQLKYKADWYGKNIVQIGRFDPSSKVCNKCGTINQGLTLADRTWTCACGAILDRDINAAKNIRDMGFAKQNLIKQEIS